MAIFGEVILLAAGLLWLVLSLINFWVTVSFSGRTSRASLVNTFAGFLIIWCAIHYGPISVSVSAGVKQ